MDLARHLLAQRGLIDFIPLQEAKDAYADFRAAHGAKRVCSPLLSAPGDNAKFAKTYVPVYGLALAQSDMSVAWNTCRFATPDCRRGCVSFAGKGELATVQAGRVRKTLFLAENPAAFFTLLMWEIGKVWRKHGVNCRVRLNTFSDIPWESVLPEIFERYPLIRFYDYTKWGGSHSRLNDLPANYTLVQSVSEQHPDSMLTFGAAAAIPQAVIFDTKRGQDLPVQYMGVRVIDGDKSDDRFYDNGVIVGLRAKGRMRDGTYDMVRKVVA